MVGVIFVRTYPTLYTSWCTQMSAENEKIMFINFTYCMKVPFTTYSDFYSLIVPIRTCSPGNDLASTSIQYPWTDMFHSIRDKNICQRINPPVSFTTNKVGHVPSGFCYTIMIMNGD